MMFIGQHTNFMDAAHYGNHELCYIGYYLEKDDPLMAKTKEELFDYLKPYIQKISGKDISPLNLFHFRAPFAQPIYDKTFVQSKPHFITPVERFYIANLDMTYPNDRGTNYAVKLGREVAAIVR